MRVTRSQVAAYHPLSALRQLNLTQGKPPMLNACLVYLRCDVLLNYAATLMTHHIKIVSWNVNGVRAAAAKGLLEWPETSQADILALQETKAHPDKLEPALHSPPGYHSAWCAGDVAHYCGVATFSRQPALTHTRGLGDAFFDTEGRVLVSTFPAFTLFNVYFPSGSSGPARVAHKLAFYQRFLELVQPRIAAGERIVVLGDVNTAYAPIDLARPKENAKTSGFLPEERAALGQFFAVGLVDTFRHCYPNEVAYSWWSMRSGARTRNVGWRLDYIFVSENLRDAIIDAAMYPHITGSDHCPVSLTLALPAHTR